MNITKKHVHLVLKNRSEYKSLINAVLNGLAEPEDGNYYQINDVCRHGMAAGFGQFIYYNDTVTFYKKHRTLINKLVFEMAEELGESAVEMVGGFSCLKLYDYKKRLWDDDNQNVIGRCIYGGRMGDDSTHIQNALCWFAVEEVCRWIQNEAENEDNN